MFDDERLFITRNMYIFKSTKSSESEEFLPHRETIVLLDIQCAIFISFNGHQKNLLMCKKMKIMFNIAL